MFFVFPQLSVTACGWPGFYSTARFIANDLKWQELLSQVTMTNFCKGHLLLSKWLGIVTDSSDPLSPITHKKMSWQLLTSRPTSPGRSDCWKLSSCMNILAVMIKSQLCCLCASPPFKIQSSWTNLYLCGFHGLKNAFTYFAVNLGPLSKVYLCTNRTILRFRILYN